MSTEEVNQDASELSPFAVCGPDSKRWPSFDAPLRIAVVGLGVISRYYLNAVETSDQFSLVAVCDIDSCKLARYDDGTVATTTAMEDLAAMGEVDAVVINLPNALHFAACELFLSAGKHVCCEKPLAIGPVEARVLPDWAARNGVALFTAFHRRYNDHIVHLRESMRAKAPCKHVRVRYLERITEHCGDDEWYLRSDECGGGVVIDNGTNVIDLLVYLLGPITIRDADIVRRESAIDIQASIRGFSDNGVEVEMILDWDYADGELKDVLVTYEDGTSESVDMLAGYKEFKSSLYHEYERVLDHFASACHSPLVLRQPDLPDGCLVTELVAQAYSHASEVESIGAVPISTRPPENLCVSSSVVKVLSHTRTNRGMTLIPETSRVLKRDEVHEIAVTDHQGLRPNDVVDRVGFLGFAVIKKSGIVEVGDELVVGDELIGSHARACSIGRVVGFDECHAPNHYNIIVEADKLRCGRDLDLVANESLTFVPSDVAANPAGGAYHPVVVGFGHAGRMLHYPCIVKTLEELGEPTPTSANPLLLIDPGFQRSRVALMHESVKVLTSACEIPAGYQQRVIAHVCTPPSMRVGPVRELLDCGVRRFILEKPVASCREDVAELERLFELHAADVLVVSNWSTSQLTDALVKRIREKSEEGNRLVSIHVSHTKSRIRRTIDSRSHSKASEVEMPHMVVLALILCEAATGTMDVQVVRAKHWDFRIGEFQVSNMGGVEAQLNLGNEIDASLYSNLLSPHKEKVVVLKFDDGVVIHGSFPIDCSELYSTLLETDETGRKIQSDCYFDDTLKQYVHRSYLHFFSGGKRPLSDFKLHLHVSSILAEIDSAGGLDFAPNLKEEAAAE